LDFTTLVQSRRLRYLGGVIRVPKTQTVGGRGGRPTGGEEKIREKRKKGEISTQTIIMKRDIDMRGLRR